MIASRPARDVRPFDRVSIRVGSVVHSGEVIGVHPAQTLPDRVVVVLNCTTCRHCDSIHFAPSALVTVERERVA